MKKTPLLLVSGLLAFASFANADDLSWRYRGIDVIDTPTAEVVDHYGYNVNFRFGQDGNLQAKTAFGVLPRLNLGFGLDGEKLIGTQDARLNKPTINFKFRIFDGKDLIPAFAIGYDGQGYVWNKSLDEYEQREKGFYLVSTFEIFVPNMTMNLGVNRITFDEGDTTRGFLGWSYMYEQTVGLMAEWDSFANEKDERINYGLKYFITPEFTIDAVGRYIHEHPGSSDHVTERIVRLSYTGSF